MVGVILDADINNFSIKMTSMYYSNPEGVLGMFIGLALAVFIIVFIVSLFLSVDKYIFLESDKKYEKKKAAKIAAAI